MQTNLLKRNNPNMKRMIVARGGKRGKTAGRGGKGQSARAGNKRRPEWRDIVKRVPKLRGRGKSSHKPVSTAAYPLNLEVIEMAFAAGDNITPTILAEKGLVSTYSGSIPAVKVLGDGEVTKAFHISGMAISASAREKIVKAGGSVKDLAPRIILKVKSEKAPKTEKVAAPVVAKAPKVEKAAAPVKEVKTPKIKAVKKAKPMTPPKSDKKVEKSEKKSK